MPLQGIGSNLPSVINNIIGNVIAFIPRLAWTIVVLAVGYAVAIWVSGKADDAARESTLFADRLAGPLAYGVKVLVIFFAVVMALSELRISTGVLVVFLDGIAFGLGVGVALVAGIALGWGSKDYVADNVEDWIQDVVEQGDGGGE
jgi:nitric oxide reductase large subunit